MISIDQLLLLLLLLLCNDKCLADCVDTLDITDIEDNNISVHILSIYYPSMLMFREEYYNNNYFHNYYYSYFIANMIPSPGVIKKVLNVMKTFFEYGCLLSRIIKIIYTLGNIDHLD